MATRYGTEIADRLVAKGWVEVPPPDGVYGDPQLRDPLTGRAHGPHDAEAIQAAREAVQGPQE